MERSKFTEGTDAELFKLVEGIENTLTFNYMFLVL